MPVHIDGLRLYPASDAATVTGLGEDAVLGLAGPGRRMSIAWEHPDGSFRGCWLLTEAGFEAVLDAKQAARAQVAEWLDRMTEERG